MATCINLIKEFQFPLSLCTVETSNYICAELSQIFEVKQELLRLESQSLSKEAQKRQLFLLYERANQQAIKTRDKGQYQIWQSWEEIVDIINLACESLESELEDNFYLIY